MKNKKQTFDDEQKKENQLRKEGVKNILSTPDGRKYLWDQLEAGYIFDTTMTGNSQTFSREGKRQAALAVFSDILDADPHAFIKMYKEFRGQNA